jgi:hypothetical protein
VEGRVSSPAWGVESGHISVAEQQVVAVVALRRPEKLDVLTVGVGRELVAVPGYRADHPRRVERALAAASADRSLTRSGAADE